MNAIEIMKNLFFIERGYLNANHFVYRSEKPVLIDTGYASDGIVLYNKREKVFISGDGLWEDDIPTITMHGSKVP